MKYRGVHVHGAHLDTLGCVVVLGLLEHEKVAPVVAERLRGLSGSGDPANQLAVGHIESWLAEMRDARRRLAAHRGELDGSAGGTAEPVEGAGGGGSSSCPPGVPLTVGQVAERCQVSESYIARRCRSGVLSATKPGREWLIDEASVIAYEASRRPVA